MHCAASVACGGSGAGDLSASQALLRLACVRRRLTVAEGGACRALASPDRRGSVAGCVRPTRPLCLRFASPNLRQLEDRAPDGPDTRPAHIERLSPDLQKLEQ